MIILIYAATSVATTTQAHLAWTAERVCKSYVYAIREDNFDNLAPLRTAAITAAPYAFPYFDKVLMSDGSRASDQEVASIFTILGNANVDCSRYASLARKIALGPRFHVKGSALRFLAKQGGKSDIKLALAFLSLNDDQVARACLDILTRFGGRDEADLIRGALAAVQGSWDDTTRDHARACLVVMEKRLAAEAKQSPAKP